MNLQIIVLALIDNTPGHPSVHSQREVLHDTEELDCVVLAVVEDLVAEHCAHGVVTDVVRHSDSPPKELHREVLVVPEVEKDAVLLLSSEGDRHVGSWLDVERLQLHEGSVVQETETCQVLASLPAVSW